MGRPSSSAAIAAVLIACLATPLAARCISAADLGRGVTVRFESGDSTTTRRVADGHLEVTERYANGDPPVRFRAAQGIYFVEEVELDPSGRPVPGTRLEIAFAIDPLDLPRPTPGIEWQGPTVNLFADGSTRNEIATVRFSRAEDLTLSGCTYETLAVDIRYDWGADGGLQLDYLYLAEPGLAIIRSNRFDGEKPSTTTPVAIEPARK